MITSVLWWHKLVTTYHDIDNGILLVQDILALFQSHKTGIVKIVKKLDYNNIIWYIIVYIFSFIKNFIKLIVVEIEQ